MSAHAVQGRGPSGFRIELESRDTGTRRVEHVHAPSMEEALVKVRDADRWPGDEDPSSFRIVEASEVDDSSESRHQRNARRRYLNTIVESGLTALGQTVPQRPTGDFSDVVCDFFTRAVVLPGRVAFPSEEADVDRLLSSHDDSRVLAQLLAVHLDHHGLKVAPRLLDRESTSATS